MQYQNIIDLRRKLCQLFPKSSAAIINLIDALASYGHLCDSVVKLSTAPCFERGYSSITKAVAAASLLSEKEWHLIMAHMQGGETVNRFAIDVTSNPRPYAKCMKDRMITHFPNPAPGNNPICVGHAYSVIVGQPQNELSRQKHWVKPLSVKRVNSSEKGNEVGMQQLIERLESDGSLNVSFGDSLYGYDSLSFYYCQPRAFGPCNSFA